jgi:hypothetical protein
VDQAALIEEVETLTDYISKGISVSVFPLVKALPGTEFVENLVHDTIRSKVKLPGQAGRELEILEWILPDDLVVREIAVQSLPKTEHHLNSILGRHGIRHDYPTSLGVLAMFKSILDVWRSMSGRTIPDDRAAAADARVDDAIATLLVRHTTQARLQRIIWNSAAGRGLTAKDLEPLLAAESLPHLLSGLRMVLDFGLDDEVKGAAPVVHWLHANGVSDHIVADSLKYASFRRFDTSDRRKIDAVLENIAA